MAVRRMLNAAQNLSDDPAVLKAMIAALQAENAKISTTLRVHDQPVQALRLRISKLQKLAFGKSSEKIECEIEQLELALEDLLVAVAKEDDALIVEGHDEPAPDEVSAPHSAVGSVSLTQRLASAASLILARAALIAAAICVWWARTSASCSI